MNQSLKEVWKISWPLIIANGFWNLQLTIDRIFLGQYSTEALAASVAVTGVFWAPMALVQQTAAYVTTFVAQYFGAKQFKWIGVSVWQSIYVSLFGGLLFLLFIPITSLLFEWIGHSTQLQKLEVSYFKALTFTALPTALVATCSGFFTGLGKSKVIIMINAVGMIFNVLFDYLFIFGHFNFPQLGIVGAGVATTIANYCAAIFGFCLILFSAEGKRFKVASGWRVHPRLFKNFLKFGVPSGLQWALEGLAFTFFLVFVGHLPNGDAALAASSITVTVMLLAILPSIGVAQGVSVLVGQYLGSNDIEKAESVTWAGLKISLIYIGLMAISFISFPELYMNLFKNPNDTVLWTEVASIVPYLLVFVAVFVVFDATNLVFSFALKGAGDTRFVSLAALLLPWPLMVLPSWYVSSWDNGVYWSWAGASVFIILQAIVFSFRFLGGRWKEMRVI